MSKRYYRFYLIQPYCTVLYIDIYIAPLTHKPQSHSSVHFSFRNKVRREGEMKKEEEKEQRSEEEGGDI